jgi:propionyl-CoA synthetase
VPVNAVGRLAVCGPTGCRYLDDLANQRKYVQDGWNFTGDAYRQDEDGYFWYVSRTDDMIVTSGYNVSGVEVENVLLTHPAVAECAVVGVADDLKGEVPVGFVVTKAGVVRPDDDIVRELVERVRGHIGPVAAFKTAIVVKRLPKTRSGKILRGTMKKIADGAEPAVPATIDDPAVLDEIGDALKGAGYPRAT